MGIIASVAVITGACSALDEASTGACCGMDDASTPKVSNASTETYFIFDFENGFAVFISFSYFASFAVLCGLARTCTVGCPVCGTNSTSPLFSADWTVYGTGSRKVAKNCHSHYYSTILIAGVERFGFSMFDQSVPDGESDAPRSCRATSSLPARRARAAGRGL